MEYRYTITKVTDSIEYPHLITTDPTNVPQTILTISATSIYHGGDFFTGTNMAGDYIVEVRAWADNNHDTLAF